MRFGVHDICKLSLLLLAAMTAFVTSAEAAQEFSVSVAPGVFGQMQMLPSGFGWVITANSLLRTENWGDNWSDITPPFTSDGFIDGVFFLDDSRGWAVTHNDTSPSAISFCATTDRGRTWSVTPFSAISNFLRTGYTGQAEISFADAGHGWVLLYQMSSSASSVGALFLTSDGGQTWDQLPFPPVHGKMLFNSPSVGWLTGGPRNQNLYRTADMGQHWAQQFVSIPSGSEQALSVDFDLPQFSDANRAFLAVKFLNPNHTLTIATYASVDAGKTWQHLNQYVGINSRRMPATVMKNSHFVTAVLDGNRLAIRGAGGARRLTTLPYSSNGMSGIAGMQFGDDWHGWLHVTGSQCAGLKTSCSSFTAWLKTDDGGLTFVPLHF